MDQEQNFKGKVVRRQINKGSNSNKIANILITEHGKEFVLRQKGKNPLQDPELDLLDGKEIIATGIITSYVLILSSFQEIDIEKEIK